MCSTLMVSLQILGGCNEDVVLEQTRETVPYFVLVGFTVFVAMSIQVCAVNGNRPQPKLTIMPANSTSPWALPVRS